jgi:hypothetical protein
VPARRDRVRDAAWRQAPHTSTPADDERAVAVPGVRVQADRELVVGEAALLMAGDQPRRSGGNQIQAAGPAPSASD